MAYPPLSSDVGRLRSPKMSGLGNGVISMPTGRSWAAMTSTASDRSRSLWVVISSQGEPLAVPGVDLVRAQPVAGPLQQCPRRGRVAVLVAPAAGGPVLRLGVDVEPVVEHLGTGVDLADHRPDQGRPVQRGRDRLPDRPVSQVGVRGVEGELVVGQAEADLGVDSRGEPLEPVDQVELRRRVRDLDLAGRQRLDHGAGVGREFLVQQPVQRRLPTPVRGVGGEDRRSLPRVDVGGLELPRTAGERDAVLDRPSLPQHRTVRLRLPPVHQVRREQLLVEQRPPVRVRRVERHPDGPAAVRPRHRDDLVVADGGAQDAGSRPGPGRRCAGSARSRRSRARRWDARRSTGRPGSAGT